MVEHGDAARWWSAGTAAGEETTERAFRPSAHGLLLAKRKTDEAWWWSAAPWRAGCWRWILPRRDGEEQSNRGTSRRGGGRHLI
ncbi:unnamed protein product [Linum trigynum]|uniref:Uncharacterized protein n=1 Tax=Linum trigynum TaxID=586398 RepID=A0AAV2E0E7_9ROSI